MEWHGASEDTLNQWLSSCIIILIIVWFAYACWMTVACLFATHQNVEPRKVESIEARRLRASIFGFFNIETDRVIQDDLGFGSVLGLGFRVSRTFLWNWFLNFQRKRLLRQGTVNDLISQRTMCSLCILYSMNHAFQCVSCILHFDHSVLFLVSFEWHTPRIS